MRGEEDEVEERGEVGRIKTFNHKGHEGTQR
jgi:hypothetical protein